MHRGTLAQATLRTPNLCEGPERPLAGRPAERDDERIEPLINHTDVTSIMRMLGDIRVEVRRIRIFLEDDDGEEEEELPERDS